MIMVRAGREEGAGWVAVRVSAESGFDPGYMLKGQAEGAARERTAGGYYINAAAGEAPGRWFGRGAAALGFAEGQVVEAAPFLAVYRQVHPVTGERLGRAPGGYATAKDILARLLEAEPHATSGRRWSWSGRRRSRPAGRPPTPT
jgi:TrwC relaxase